MNGELALIDWIKLVKDFKAGWHGLVIVVLTIICTAIGAYYGIDLFPDGSYSRIVLAIPGLLIGAISFLIFCVASWALFGRKIDPDTLTKKPLVQILVGGVSLLIVGAFILAVLWNAVYTYLF